MADTLVPCPSAEALEGIAAGQSAPPDLTNHLLECAACARLLQRIRDDNLFLRGFVVDGALPTSPRPKRQHEIAIAGYEILHEIHRGGQGVISIQVTERNGLVVGACVVAEADEVMLISSGGTLIRTRVKEISMVGRNTQGVRLIEPDEGETLAGVEVVAESDDE